MTFKRSHQTCHKRTEYLCGPSVFHNFFRSFLLAQFGGHKVWLAEMDVNSPLPVSFHLTSSPLAVFWFRITSCNSCSVPVGRKFSNSPKFLLFEGVQYSFTFLPNSSHVIGIKAYLSTCACLNTDPTKTYISSHYSYSIPCHHSLYSLRRLRHV